MDVPRLERTWRALASATIPLPKEVDATIHARATDAFADALFDACIEVGCPLFSIAHAGDSSLDHSPAASLVGFAKVYGDPWQLMDVLTGLRALSVRFPEHAIRIRFDPDGADGEVRDGSFTGIPFDDIAAWVAANPMPGLDDADKPGLRARLVCTCSKSARDSLRAELARRDHVVITEIRGGLAISVDAPHVILSSVGTALHGLFFERKARCELELGIDGGATWRCTASSFSEGFALDTVLRSLLVGLPRPLDIVAPIVLPAAPELARVASAGRIESAGIVERLELDFQDESPPVILGDDGRFVVAPIEPRYWSADRRFAARLSYPYTVVWIDTKAGIERDVSAAPPHYDRGGGYGFVGDDLVISEMSLQLGRIRKRFVMHAPDGTERKSRVFINTGAEAIDEPNRRVIMTAERDGVSEWLAVDLTTFAETQLPIDRANEPHTRIVHEGTVFGILGDYNTTRIVRYRRHSDEPLTIDLARLPGRVDHQIVIDGTLWLVTNEHEPVERSSLHEVSLPTGTARTISLGDGGTQAFSLSDRTDARTQASARIATPWIAWAGDDGAAVRVFHGIEPVRDIQIAETETAWDVAISRTGALALVLQRREPDGSRGDGAILEVRRGDDRARVELPTTCSVGWRSGRGSAP